MGQSRHCDKLVRLADIDPNEFNVANKLLKLDADAKTPIPQVRGSVGADDLYTPTDYGLNWASVTTLAQGFGAIQYLGNGIVIGTGTSGHIYRSIDYGLTWIDVATCGVNYIRSSAYCGNGIVLVGSENGHIYKSTDYGLTWTDLGTITGAWVQGMEYLGNGIVLAGGDYHNNYKIHRSTDYGATWDSGEVAGNYDLYAIEYLGNGITVSFSFNVFRSTDYGENWTDEGDPNPPSGIVVYRSAYLGNGIILAGGGSGLIVRSKDYGVTWSSLGDITGTSDNIWSMKYLGNGVIVLGTVSHHVWRSTDYGITWTDLGVIASTDIDAIGYLENGITILCDTAGHVFRSVPAFSAANFNPNQFDKLFQFGCLGAITPNGTSYLAPGNGATQTNEITIRAPRPGILKNFYIQQRVASGAGGRTDIYTVRVNGADTTITCTLDNATQGADTTHEVLVAAGDRISVKLVSNNAADTSADSIATLELV